jgi:hypothetical protein
LNPSKGKVFSLLHKVHTGSGAHSAFYKMGILKNFPGLKTTRVEADPSIPSTVEDKNGGSISPLSICLNGIVVN